jgi:glucokinase
MNSSKNKVMVLDVGGTNIRVAAIMTDGTIVSRYKCPTNAAKGPEKVIKGLVKAIKTTISRAKLHDGDIKGICLSIAGSVDNINGIVNSSPHLPGWQDVPLREIIEDALELKTEILNDASAAALGEHRFGAGRDIKNMVHITIGTGIGGGIIINNELYLGANGIAGEFGHMSVVANGLKCSCGNKGCWELYASGSAIEREARRIVKSEAESYILTLAEGNIDGITGRTVARAADLKDRSAVKIIENTAYYFGVGLAGIINIFNPEIIVVGGGLSSLGEKLLRPARKVVKERAFSLPTRTVKIVRSQLKDNAGLLGAAVYMYDS